MKTRLFAMMAAAMTAMAAMSMSPFQAIIDDNDGPATNIRVKPNGKIAMSVPTYNTYMVNISSPSNGWWQVDYIYDPVEDQPVSLYGSTTGKYWIHYSVLGLTTRNYGHQRWCLRKSPSERSKAVYYFNEVITVRPMDISRDGDWVKVKTFDKKHSGWIEIWNLCDNPLTTCP